MAFNPRGSSPILLPVVDLETDEPVYACGDVSPFTYDSKDYLPFGTLGAVGEIQATSGATVADFQIGCMLARAGNENDYAAFQAAVQSTRSLDVIGKIVTYKMLQISPTSGSVMGERVMMKGFASHITADIGPERTIMLLHCEPEIGGALGPRASFLTNEDQQRRFPGDIGLGRASRQASSLQITWDPVA